MDSKSFRHISRRETRKINVGDVSVGGDSPISIQSMTNTLTSDPIATSDQISALVEAGADLVRVSCPDKESTKSLSTAELPTKPLSKRDSRVDMSKSPSKSPCPWHSMQCCSKIPRTSFLNRASPPLISAAWLNSWPKTPVSGREHRRIPKYLKRSFIQDSKY